MANESVDPNAVIEVNTDITDTGGSTTGVNTSIADTGGSDTGIGGIDAPEYGLPAISATDFNDIVNQGGFHPNGFSNTLNEKKSSSGDSSDREAIVKYAKKFLGVWYQWGGSSPRGFDCSGLTQYVAKHFGLNLPRISNQQANFGKRTSIGNLRPGDLVAWDENKRNNGADHIAFYIGNGYILEAAHTGTQVRIRKLGKHEGAWGVALKYPK